MTHAQQINILRALQELQSGKEVYIYGSVPRTNKHIQNVCLSNGEILDVTGWNLK